MVFCTITYRRIFCSIFLTFFPTLCFPALTQPSKERLERLVVHSPLFLRDSSREIYQEDEKQRDKDILIIRAQLEKQMLRSQTYDEVDDSEEIGSSDKKSIDQLMQEDGVEEEADQEEDEGESGDVGIFFDMVEPQEENSPLDNIFDTLDVTLRQMVALAGQDIQWELTDDQKGGFYKWNYEKLVSSEWDLLNRAKWYLPGPQSLLFVRAFEIAQKTPLSLEYLDEHLKGIKQLSKVGSKRAADISIGCKALASLKLTFFDMQQPGFTSAYQWMEAYSEGFSDFVKEAYIALTPSGKKKITSLVIQPSCKSLRKLYTALSGFHQDIVGESDILEFAVGIKYLETCLQIDTMLENFYEYFKEETIPLMMTTPRESGGCSSGYTGGKHILGGLNGLIGGFLAVGLVCPITAPGSVAVGVVLAGVAGGYGRSAKLALEKIKIHTLVMILRARLCILLQALDISAHLSDFLITKQNIEQAHALRERRDQGERIEELRREVQQEREARQEDMAQAQLDMEARVKGAREDEQKAREVAIAQTRYEMEAQAEEIRKQEQARAEEALRREQETREKEAARLKGDVERAERVAQATQEQCVQAERTLARMQTEAGKSKQEIEKQRKLIRTLKKKALTAQRKAKQAEAAIKKEKEKREKDVAEIRAEAVRAQEELDTFKKQAEQFALQMEQRMEERMKALFFASSQSMPGLVGESRPRIVGTTQVPFIDYQQPYAESSSSSSSLPSSSNSPFSSLSSSSSSSSSSLSSLPLFPNSGMSFASSHSSIPVEDEESGSESGFEPGDEYNSTETEDDYDKDSTPSLLDVAKKGLREPMRQLVVAIKNNRQNEVLKLLKRYPLLLEYQNERTGSKGWTPLFHAAFEDKQEIVRSLFKQKANILHKTPTGRHSIFDIIPSYSHQGVRDILRGALEGRNIEEGERETT